MQRTAPSKRGEEDDKGSEEGEEEAVAYAPPVAGTGWVARHNASK